MIASVYSCNKDDGVKKSAGKMNVSEKKVFFFFPQH